VSSSQPLVPTPVKAKPPNSSSGRNYRTYAEFRYDIENGPQENTDGQLVPRVTRQGYSTIPSLDILKKMSADQLKEVVDFTVEREGVGSVRFLGTTGTLSYIHTYIYISMHTPHTFHSKL
jgi:hypothetical protein